MNEVLHMGWPFAVVLVAVIYACVVIFLSKRTD